MLKNTKQKFKTIHHGLFTVICVSVQNKLWVSYMHVFCIFVFAPVQRNWACFTWKGALEIRSLLSSTSRAIYCYYCFSANNPGSSTVISVSVQNIQGRLLLFLFQCKTSRVVYCYFCFNANHPGSSTVISVSMQTSTSRVVYCYFRFSTNQHIQGYLLLFLFQCKTSRGVYCYLFQCKPVHPGLFAVISVSTHHRSFTVISVSMQNTTSRVVYCYFCSVQNSTSRVVYCYFCFSAQQYIKGQLLLIVLFLFQIYSNGLPVCAVWNWLHYILSQQT